MLDFNGNTCTMERKVVHTKFIDFTNHTFARTFTRALPTIVLPNHLSGMIPFVGRKVQSTAKKEWYSPVPSSYFWRAVFWLQLIIISWLHKYNRPYFHMKVKYRYVLKYIAYAAWYILATWTISRKCVPFLCW